MSDFFASAQAVQRREVGWVLEFVGQCSAGMIGEFIGECHQPSIPAFVAKLNLAEMVVSEVGLSIVCRSHVCDVFRRAKVIDIMEMIAECRIFTSSCGDYKK